MKFRVLIKTGLTLLLAGGLPLLAPGCKKQTTEPAPAVDSSIQLPETATIRSALDQKDYTGAVAAFLRQRESIAGDEQQTQYSALMREVRGKLLDASASDPKAAEALQVLMASAHSR